ncbi:MAG: patatin-like phospholipase family protein [Gaiellaceae bacterium]
MEHVPALAAGDAPGPRRSLILAGGGMRVAYQAGVLRALEEEGLRFVHGDGTSGGTINLAMLLSGVEPAEMCVRWRTLRVRDFVSLLPLRRYLRAPKLMAFGDADGIVERVFPHLGVDVDRIRAARGIEGTFNVCDFAAKTNVAVPHTEIDLDLLVAGITLPIFMPPVQRDGRLFVDSVWIKDANPSEAVRRGCEELWLVWCIGNSSTYRPGAFDQYVHMIELSANGGLFEELAHLRARTDPLPRLHVIKPEFPLPLDPDFYLGRVDADALVAMGYRDAKAYLARRPEGGVPWDESATRMRDPALGVAFARRLRGGSVRVDVRDLARFRDERTAEAVGVLDDGRIARGGQFRLEGRRRVYELDVDGDRVILEGGLRDAVRFLWTLQATGPYPLRRRLAAVLRFGWLLASPGRRRRAASR